MEQQREPVVEYRAGNEFSLAGAKTRLMSIKIPNLPEDFSPSELVLRKSALINMDNTEGLCCAGALINFLKKGNLGFQFDGNDFEVDLKMFSLFVPLSPLIFKLP